MNKITIEELKLLAEIEGNRRLEKERARKEEEERKRLEMAPIFLKYFEELIFGAKILTLKENGNFDLFGYEMFPYKAGLPIKLDPNDKYRDCRGYVLVWRGSASGMVFDLESAYKFVEERRGWEEAKRKSNTRKSFFAESFEKFLDKVFK